MENTTDCVHMTNKVTPIECPDIKLDGVTELLMSKKIFNDTDFYQIYKFFVTTNTNLETKNKCVLNFYKNGDESDRKEITINNIFIIQVFVQSLHNGKKYDELILTFKDTEYFNFSNIYSFVKKYVLPKKDYPELISDEDKKKLIEANLKYKGCAEYRIQEKKLWNFFDLLDDRKKDYTDEEVGMMYNYIIHYDGKHDETGEMCIIYPKCSGTILKEKEDRFVVSYVLNYYGYSELARLDFFKNEYKVIICKDCKQFICYE
jgi:hypothetical protein